MWFTEVTESLVHCSNEYLEALLDPLSASLLDCCVFLMADFGTRNFNRGLSDTKSNNLNNFNAD